MPRGILVAVLLVGLLAVGCQSREQKLAGYWVARKDMPADFQQSSVTLRADGTFVASLGAYATGTWRLAGNTVELHMREVAGLSASYLAETPLGQIWRYQLGSGDREMTTLPSPELAKLNTHDPKRPVLVLVKE